MKIKTGLLSLIAGTLAQSQGAEQPVGTAFSSTLFDGVHIIDIEASTQAWVDSLGEKHDIGKAAPVQIYEDPDNLSKAVDTDQFELGVLSATHFLQIEHPEKLEPKYVAGCGDEVLQSLLLLVRKDSGITSLEQLKDREILLPVNRYSAVTHYWLETMLMERKLAPGKEAYFSAIGTHKKSTCVVLPVFFGKCDACIVCSKTFQVMCELNPQIGRSLIPLEISPPYLASLICMRKDADEELKRKLGIAVSTLHESIDGSQVLMSFHVNKYELYEAGQLNNTKALLKRYQTLKADYETP